MCFVKQALVDCPNTDVPRHALNYKWMSLTDLKVKLPRGARSKHVRKAFEDEQVETKWSKTAWAKRIAQFKRRAELTDFDRFKVKLLKQKVLFDFSWKLCYVLVLYMNFRSPRWSGGK